MSTEEKIAEFAKKETTTIAKNLWKKIFGPSDTDKLDKLVSDFTMAALREYSARD